ncbi:MAG: SDR family oxidoreductase [Flavobacteriales bacterium]|jgi:NAD(P)-dependent dehydrogenase (short-subunit alcohol dehydrogenase family)|nr:SDR family oxidoreductase [Flavobacteriales bacterium]
MTEKQESVLVTGAGSGIGLETVRALLVQSTVDIIVIARNGRQRLDAELQDHPTRIHVIEQDLLASDAIEQIVAGVSKKRLVGLVHNAAELIKVEFGQYAREELLRVYEINVVIPMLLTQALISPLTGHPNSHVVSISSMGGFQDSTKFPGLLGYSSSKAALACMAQCLAVEFAEHGIKSNCLALGSVDTPMLRAAFPGYKAASTAAEMGTFIAEFTLKGHKVFNGKVLPVSASTP